MSTARAGERRRHERQCGGLLPGTASVAAVQIGDVAWMDSDPAATPPFVQIPAYPIGTVTSSTTSAQADLRLESLRPHGAGAPVTTGGGFTLRVYRPAVTRSSEQRRRDEEIEFASVAGMAGIRSSRSFRRRAARCRRRSMRPWSSLQYGIIEKFVDRADLRGETNLVPNSFMRTWSGRVERTAGRLVVRQRRHVDRCAPRIPRYTAFGGFAGIVTSGRSGASRPRPSACGASGSGSARW
jgi:hypothetical protein